MRKYFILMLALAIHLFTIAQEKQLTLENAVMGRGREFNPANLPGLQWAGSSGKVAYVKDWKTIVTVDVKSGTTSEVINLSQINQEMKKNSMDTLRYISSFHWTLDGKITLNLPNGILLFNASSRMLEKSIILPEGAAYSDYSPNAGAVAYTMDNNLYYKTSSGLQKQVTRDTDRNFVNGQIVSRNEFGIDKGTFWSPSGRYLAFYRKDESHVTNYPLVDVTTRFATLNLIKYPMAGMESERVSLGIYNLSTGKTVFCEADSTSDKYLTSVTWSPDEKYIYIAVLNRDQNHLWLNRYDAGTGLKLNTLFEEENSRYVEPLDPLYFIDGQRFIWFSNRDGYRHMYLYTSDGILIRQLTRGSWIVKDFLGIDPKITTVWFRSTITSPLDIQVCSVPVAKGETRAITLDAGIHTAQLSPDGQYLIDNFEAVNIPREISILDSKGKQDRLLLDAPDPLKDYRLGRMTIFTVKAADGKTDLYCRMIKPVDFDSTRKYPVVVYVYGGPHAQMITHSWMGGARLWDYYMAQKGYIMFTLDNRGSSNRGFEFESIIHRQLGQEEMKDQMKGVDYLESLPYVDKSRLGVHGWSFGGFMTISLMLQHPGIFNVAVAGGPVTDWKFYEVMYGERYMDRPQENPEGYEKTSLLDKAGNLNGHLLIIHGAQDKTVVWQNSLDLLQQFIKAKKQVDYFVYPTHEHNVSGIDRVHLMQKITDYFDLYLKP